MTLYRYGMTFAAGVVLTAGGVGFMTGWEHAVYAPGLFIFLLFLVGVENAWALLLGDAAASTGGTSEPGGRSDTTPQLVSAATGGRDERR